MPQLSLPGVNKHQPRCSTKRPQPPLLTPSKDRIPHQSLHQAGHHSHGLTFTVGPRDLFFNSSQHIPTTTKDSTVTMPGSHSPLNRAKALIGDFPRKRFLGRPGAPTCCKGTIATENAAGAATTEGAVDTCSGCPTATKGAAGCPEATIISRGRCCISSRVEACRA